MSIFSKIMASFVVLFLFAGPAFPAEEWDGPWEEDFNVEISRALAQNNVSLCGEYKYKKSAKSSKEYIVHCTPDGTNWYAYIVWTGINKIMGPYQPEIK